jgi:hypothetical protein
MALDPKDPLIPLPWQMDDIRNYREQKKAKLEAEIIDRQIKQLDLQKKLLESPEAQIQRAGELAERSLQVEQDLASQRGLAERLGTRAANVRAAATPLPAGAAGPVMPEDLAISTGQQLLEQQDLARARVARIGGELEAIRKQREGLEGSVNLGEFYGSAPASDTTSVAKRRYQETTKLLGDLDADIKNSRTPEEASAKSAAAKEIKPWFNLQTKRELDNTLKVRGLDGFAPDTAIAKDMRERTAGMVNSVSQINALLALGDEADRIKRELPSNLQGQALLRVQRRADLIRTPLVASLRVPLTGGGQLSDAEREFLQAAVANPTDFINFASRDRLIELSRVVKRDFTTRARAAGFNVNSLQPVFDAYSDPEDIDVAGPKITLAAPEAASETRRAPAMPSFDSEEAARAAGYKDGDLVNIGGVMGTLEP